MKLLLYSLNHAPELAGIGRYNGEMVEWLRERGVEVEVVTANPYYPEWKLDARYPTYLYSRETLGGVPVFRAPHYVPRKVSFVKRVLHLASFALTSLPLLFWRLAAFRPDVVFVVEPTLAAVPGALLSARLFGARTWVHVQDFEVEAAFAIQRSGGPSLAKRLALAVENTLLRGADRVSTISQKMLERLRAKSIPRERAVHFPNWIDPNYVTPGDRMNPIRSGWGFGADDFVVLYSGNMGEKQGLEMVIECARRLRDRKNIRFIMGGAGAARDRLVKAAEGLTNILWLPLQPKETFSNFLAAGDLHLITQLPDVEDLVLPSKLFGIMASERPVLATAAAGTQLHEICRDCGWVTPPGDLDAFERAILDAAASPASGLERGRKGREILVGRWARDEVLTEFLERGLKPLVKSDRP